MIARGVRVKDNYKSVFSAVDSHCTMPTLAMCVTTYVSSVYPGMNTYAVTLCASAPRRFSALVLKYRKLNRSRHRPVHIARLLSAISTHTVSNFQPTLVAL